MKSYRLAASREDSASLVSEIRDLLDAGQVGIVPTDTVYGLVCRHGLPASLARLYAIKGRDHDKKCQLLIAGEIALAQLGIEISASLRRLIDAFWPGPLTIVVRNRVGEELGVRCPGSAFARALAEGVPLAASSANPSGQTEADSLACKFENLPEKPDFCVFGPAPTGIASTVVRLAEDDCQLLREGEISGRQIALALDN